MSSDIREAPRRLPAAERRRAIVSAALRVFSSTSYAGATTAEIAREAGVSEPMLYRHFASKRDLWIACLDLAWFETRTRLEGKIALFTGGTAPGAQRPRDEVVHLAHVAADRAADDRVLTGFGQPLDP